MQKDKAQRSWMQTSLSSSLLQRFPASADSASQPLCVSPVGCPTLNILILFGFLPA